MTGARRTREPSHRALRLYTRTVVRARVKAAIREPNDFAFDEGTTTVAVPMPARPVSGVLIGLLVFGAISSFAGAVLAFNAEGVGVPLDLLARTPLDSFALPGLVLGVIVGGSQSTAAITLLTRRPSALLWGAIAGFGMLIWIFTEMAIIESYSWLQALYFGLGVLELILVLALLGIAPNLASPWRPVRRAER
jgi:hypothetical protein